LDEIGKQQSANPTKNLANPGIKSGVLLFYLTFEKAINILIYG